ncbi:cytochrome P450 family protein [Pleurotus pulmonarius]
MLPSTFLTRYRRDSRSSVQRLALCVVNTGSILLLSESPFPGNPLSTLGKSIQPLRCTSPQASLADMLESNGSRRDPSQRGSSTCTKYPMDSAHVGFLLAAGLVSFLALRARKKPPYPPGPPSDPLIGHLRILPFENREVIFHAWAKEYGDIMHLHALGFHLVVLDSREAAIDLLEKRGAIYSDRPYLRTFELLGHDDITLMPYGASFRDHRKFVHSAMTKEAIVTYQAAQTTNARLLVSNLCENKNQHEMLINRWATSIVTSIVYGQHSTAEVDEYMKLMEDHNEIILGMPQPGGSILELFPFLEHLPAWFPGTGDAYKARQWRPSFRRIYDYPYEQAEKNMAPTDDSILSRAWPTGALFRASVETTWSTVVVMLASMILNPECQKRGQEEISRVIGSERLPEFEDMDALPYTTAIVHEVMRWHPVVPLALPHRSVQDDVYRGMFIPKGAIVLPNVTGMSLDEKVYKNPTLFNPSRFLPQLDGQGEPRFDAAFGFGRRICPGRHFAFSSVWILTATLLATSNISEGKDANGVTIPLSREFKSAITSRPKEFACEITARSSASESLLSAHSA